MRPTISLSQLMDHVQELRTEDKWIDGKCECQVCGAPITSGRQCDRAGIVVRHLQTHLAEVQFYPFQCPEKGCEHTAIRREKIEIHVLKDHVLDWTEDRQRRSTRYTLSFYTRQTNAVPAEDVPSASSFHKRRVSKRAYEKATITLEELHVHVQELKADSKWVDGKCECEVCGGPISAARANLRSYSVARHLLTHLSEVQFYPFRCPEDGCDHPAIRREQIKDHLLKDHGLEWTDDKKHRSTKHPLSFYTQQADTVPTTTESPSSSTSNVSSLNVSYDARTSNTVTEADESSSNSFDSVHHSDDVHNQDVVLKRAHEKATITLEELHVHVQELKADSKWVDGKCECEVCGGPISAARANLRSYSVARHLLTHLSEVQFYPFRCPEDGCDYPAIRLKQIKDHLLKDHGLEWTDDKKHRSTKHPLSFYTQQADTVPTTTESPSSSTSNASSLNVSYDARTSNTVTEADESSSNSFDSVHHSDDVHNQDVVLKRGYRKATITLEELYVHVQVLEADSKWVDGKCECEVCGSQISSVRPDLRCYSVARHLLTHLSEVQFYPFRCPEDGCDHPAIRLKQIKDHLLKDHGIEWTEDLKKRTKKYTTADYYQQRIQPGSSGVLRPKKARRTVQSKKQSKTVLQDIANSHLPGESSVAAEATKEPTKADVVAIVHDAILLGEDTCKRTTLNGSVKRWLFDEKERALLAHIYELLKSDRVSTLRDVFYKMKEVSQTLFGTGDKGDVLQSFYDSFRKLCDKLGVSRDQFQVTAAPKGYVYGNLQIRLKDDSVIDFRQTLMPVEERFCDAVSMTSLGSNSVQAILWVEQHCTLERLRENSVLTKFPQVIFITGCGQPTYACKRFGCLIAKRLRVPTYIMSDCDVYGLQIALTLMQGNVRDRNKVQNGGVRLDNAVWLGLKASDILDKSKASTLNDEAAKLLPTIIRKAESCGSTEMMAEGLRMLDERSTFSLRAADVDTFERIIHRDVLTPNAHTIIPRPQLAQTSYPALFDRTEDVYEFRKSTEVNHDYFEKTTASLDSQAPYPDDEMFADTVHHLIPKETPLETFVSYYDSAYFDSPRTFMVL